MKRFVMPKDETNFLLVSLGDGHLEITKSVNGVYTSIATKQVPEKSSYRLGLSKVGTNYVLRCDETEIPFSMSDLDIELHPLAIHPVVTLDEILGIDDFDLASWKGDI
jgi:hypothetical protein